MGVHILWAVAMLVAVACICNAAENIAKLAFKSKQEPDTKIIPLPEVDEKGEAIPTFDDIIAAVYGREDEHE